MAASAVSLRASTKLARPSTKPTRGRVSCAATTRPVWLPNGMTAPSYLNDTLPGDYGFDPFLFGAQPERLKWYAEAEKTNGRWAMMAVVGILGPELLGVPGHWYEQGAKEYGIPNIPLLAIEATVMGFLETKRFQGFKETGTSGFINSFPFDPLGQNSKDMATKEVKNGRLAMVAFAGFAVQALVTRQGPIEGLKTHLADPFGRNVTYYLTHLPEVLAGTA